MDLDMIMDGVRFSVRTAAVVRHKDEVLFSKNSDNDYFSFPGGKIKLGESIVPSVKREVYEETGLKLNSVRICGVKDWYDKKEKERQLIILFTSDDYSGDIISETSEGKIYWIDEDELKNTKLADDFDKLLKVFKNEEINEMVYEENENQDEKLRWDLKLY